MSNSNRSLILTFPEQSIKCVELINLTVTSKITYVHICKFHHRFIFKSIFQANKGSLRSAFVWKSFYPILGVASNIYAYPCLRYTWFWTEESNKDNRVTYWWARHPCPTLTLQTVYTNVQLRSVNICCRIRLETSSICNSPSFLNTLETKYQSTPVSILNAKLPPPPLYNLNFFFFHFS